MSRAVRAARTALAWLLTSLVLSAATGLGTTVRAEAAVQAYTATGAVYVRSGPGTGSTVLGTLAQGQAVSATGPAVEGWLPISYSGSTAYVSAAYLAQAAVDGLPLVTGPASTGVTAVNLNARATAGLGAEIVTVLAKGATVQLTGRTLGDFSEASIDGTLRWVFTKYLASAPVAPAALSAAGTATGGTNTAITTTGTTAGVALPAIKATMATTSDLALRTSSASNATTAGTIPAKTRVGLTGKHEAGYSQIVIDGALRWILTGYLTPVPGATALSLPTAVGLRYVTSNGVAVRATAAAAATQVSTVSYRAVLQVTGVVKSTYTQVIYSGVARWVATSKLSATKPSTASLGSASLDKLKAYGKTLVVDIWSQFPAITTTYGWRSYSAYSSDHPNGRAVDFMLPSYKSNKALGDAIAKYVIDNNKRLHVNYVIWRQRTYTISRGYWVSMSDRGSDTANHYDHVHVSLFD